MAKLVCQAGPNAGHEYPLNRDKVMFGRQRTCDVQIMDSMASREHFLIRRDGNLYTLVDLESRNGTHLNNRKINERQLDFGDVIRVGEVEYILVKEDGDADVRDLLTKKYTILEKIGEGGMGIVYKAIQKSMERKVALKILAPKYSSRSRFVDQFIREARAAGALNHPNIIQVHDVASENGVHYFSMEFIDGPTAMRMLNNEGKLPESVACEIIRQTAKALAYAHEQRIIHRDIKPDNIMVTSNNTVKLADLGISKTFDEAEAEGKPKRIVGTPHYMAPEASLGNRIDHRVDIYSLGVTFYHLLSGHTPFSGTKAAEVLKAHIRDTPPPLISLVPGLDPEVVQLVEAMMAKEVEERIQSAEEISERVQAILDRLNSNDGNRKGEETVMLRRMVSAVPENALGGAGKSTVAATTDGRGKRQGLGTTHARSDEHGRQRGMNPTKAALRLGILLIGLAIAWLLFSKLKQAVSADQQPEAATQAQPTPQPIHETSEAQVSRGSQSPPITRQATEQRETVTRQLAELGQQVSTAQSPNELARALEQIRELRRVSDDPTTLARLQTMEETVVTRIQGAMTRDQRAEFNQVEREVLDHLNANNFVAARNRLDGFSAGDNPLINEERRRLSERIDADRERYEQNLVRRVERAISGRDAETLRGLREAMPATMLEHPIAARITEAIRELDREREARSERIINDGWRHLLAMHFPETRLHIRQHQGNDTELDATLNDLLAQANATEQALNQLHRYLQGLDRPPRFRGNLRGMQDPDILGAQRAGLMIRIASGGQASVPWSDIEPSQLIAVLDLALADADAETKALRSVFQAWLKMVAPVRN
ncbi:MAG: FHA domain-containing protein [Planctomycetota bacterium]|nr:MAG: FHA domain-containing protein [Planctomycetota bacterium]